MTTLTLMFRRWQENIPVRKRRQWFAEIAGFCRSIYGEEKHEELRIAEEKADLSLRDYVDLMLTTALPDCRIHHSNEGIEVKIDFDNDAEAVAFHLRHVNF